eukprot:TRINITY_DN7874_c0_g1_i11.p1 TRINITY_DN7874_c0_g1~~TRINITY_DN7874_c0_g1_i11.p1  ORF type:complete len:170 (-),score=34.00 TRINITY_DN7874_c0_g1_i11:56-565(-)
MIGYHEGMEVCLGHRLSNDYETQNDPDQVVDQVCCAAVNMQQGMTGEKNKHHDETFEKMNFVLQASYEATYLGALCKGRKKIFLTLVGGGVFGNNTEVIFRHLLHAHKQWAGHKMSELEKVVLVLFSGTPPASWLEMMKEEGVPFVYKQWVRGPNGEPSEQILNQHDVS